MSYLPPDKVKQGFWVDESRGQVLGSTITTTTTKANIVIAVLAIVVSLASVHLWHLLLFAFYQIRANKDLGDGLYRQQQALLRSLSSPEKTLFDFAKLGWAWYGKIHNSTLRTLIPALVALLFTALALAVSITSSLIVSTSTITILVNSNNCGSFAADPFSPEAQNYGYSSLGTALEYARTCYLTNVTSGPCVKYVQPKLNFSTTRAPCPFDSSMCLSAQQDPAVALDTGYMDSNDDFGINAAPGDRVLARKRTTCAPLKVDGYYTVVNVDKQSYYANRKPLPGEQEFELQYGVQPGFQGTFNAKYGYSTYKSNITRTYEIRSEKSGPSYDIAGGYPSLIPIHELQRTDADTILIWIFLNSVQSQRPINDPVFASHTKSFYLETGSSAPNITVYSADHPYGGIGCAEQYQFCIRGSDGLQCTELAGLPTNASQVALHPNEKQLGTFQIIHDAMQFDDFSNVGQEPDALQALLGLASNGIQPYLPDNQWEIEVNMWESFVLACIQKFLTDRAIGPGIDIQDGREAHFTPPNTAMGKSFCKTQKMTVDGGFANISVFGLAFTIALSCVFIFTDIILLRALIFSNRFGKWSWAPRIDRWIHDGVLQLQRKAYEGMGEGEWAGRDNEVPVLVKDELLSDFQDEYPISRSVTNRTKSSAPISRQSTLTTAGKPLVQDRVEPIPAVPDSQEEKVQPERTTSVSCGGRNTAADSSSFSSAVSPLSADV